MASWHQHFASAAIKILLLNKNVNLAKQNNLKLQMLSKQSW